MKFVDYKYERPDFNKTSEEVLALVKIIEESKDLNTVKEAIDKVNAIKSTYQTQTTLAFIRNSIDTTDEFYEAERNAIDENDGVVNSAFHKFQLALVNHSLRGELEKIYGQYWFKTTELSLKTFDDSIIDLLVEESKLSSQYSKLMATAKIEFNGEELSLPRVRKYLSNTDRSLRKLAMEKINGFFKANEAEIDDIYDKMVKNRDAQAKKLGFDSFIELAYARMGRTDYTKKEVANYRKQVIDEIVPVANKIILENAKRIGIDNPKFYDFGLEFLDGNPTPKGNRDELVAKALKMYSEMSAETKEFFTFMVEGDLLDLENKPGKQNGGYCTFINDFKAPFIFSNFNGTKGDVDVLTHEAGHAFMAYSCRDIKIPDLIWPTSDAAEIHSMSMEFLAYPWMKEFFGDDANKYFVSHMGDALTFIPYGICVDHFQHMVFENPNATPSERKEMWKKCEKMYTPMRDMDGMEMYEKGCFWYNQPHIFTSPFYYVDYTLAQICALEFYLDSLDNREETWNRYVALCKLGGSDSFLNLISKVGLHNPFIDGSLKNIVNRLLPVIEKVKI